MKRPQNPKKSPTKQVVSKQFLKFETEGQEFAKFLGSLGQFVQTVKGQNKFW